MEEITLQVPERSAERAIEVLDLGSLRAQLT